MVLHQMRRAADRLTYKLHSLAFDSDLKALRLMLGLAAMLTGLGLLWPVDTFSGQTYALMAQIAPEWVWGLAFFSQGLLVLWSMILDYRTKWLLWVDACFGSALWTTAVTACYLAYWPGLANAMSYNPPVIMGGEVATALASWWVLVRYHFDGDTRG